MEKIFYSAVCCLIAVSVADATVQMFDSSSEVVDLTEANFDKMVMQSDDVWIVEFYAPWCGHCQRLAPEYDRAAKGLKGVVRVGGVNCDVEKNLPGRFGIKGFPTLKIFGVDKSQPETFSGERNTEGVISAAFSALRRKVDAAIGLNSDKEKRSEKSVIELTDANFDKTVLKSDDMWLVEFYAPWCGHCRNLAPHYAKAASSLRGKVKLGSLDATVHTIKASEYRIQGYPTILYFPPGKKDKESATEYSGDRTSSGIVSWSLEKLAKNVPPPDIKQVVRCNQNIDNCY